MKIGSKIIPAHLENALAKNLNTDPHPPSICQLLWLSKFGSLWLQFK